MCSSYIPPELKHYLKLQNITFFIIRDEVTKLFIFFNEIF